MRSDIDHLLGGLDSVKVGDEMVFTYLPGTGTTLLINGKKTAEIATPMFGRVILSVWFGAKPPTSSLKKAMLGK